MGFQKAASSDRPSLNRPFLISFSGIDGAGKTTQIEQLTASLRELGFRVLRLSFWDDVAVWSKLRAGVGGEVSPNDSKTRGENSFVSRNNKHVRKWYLTWARSGMYVLDVLRLRGLLVKKPITDADVVIFDRYVYDQIANIDSRSAAARIYRKFVLKQTPVPELAFIIDASPDAAFARKPEYPLEFVHRNRQNFLRLREIAPELIVVAEGRPESVTSEIYLHILRSRLPGELRMRNNATGTPEAVGQQLSSCRVENQPTAGR